MQSKYGFTRFDTIEEFKNWLNKQPKYNYTGIQVHHTDLPNYSCFYKSNGRHEDELTRQNNMKSFHVNTNHWSDIAQHFTIFPNGKIVTGRSLAKTTAIGIKGWNSGKICIEIYGDFDKGMDIMTNQQKTSVVQCYSLLCKKFGITPSSSTIRMHCHFTAGGTYLGTYSPSRSAKTCPGTNFMGIGNSKAALDTFVGYVKNAKVGEDIPNYVPPADVSNPEKVPPLSKGKYIVRYLQKVLNEDYNAGLVVDSSYGSKTKAAVKAHPIKRGSKGEFVGWLQAALNNRVKAGLSTDNSFGPATQAALRLYQAKRKLTCDGICGLETVTAIVND